MKNLPVPSEMHTVMSFFRRSVMVVHTISYRILATLLDANQHFSVSVVKAQAYQVVSIYQNFTYTQLVFFICLHTKSGGENLMYGQSYVHLK